MMVDDLEYQRNLDKQVNKMLKLARKGNRSFSLDCKNDPGKLQQHWAERLDIVYYSSREQDKVKAIREDGRTVDDNASFADLLGFFSPSPRPGTELDRAYVAWDEGSFTTRRNFTLLHEIGHYLQETDFDLMKRICSFESDYAGKRFEEDACNRFASLALLPDTFLSKWLDPKRSPRAQDIHAIFEDGRNHTFESNKVRVSRIAVTRRIGALLPSLGYASLIEKPYGKDGLPKVVCRAWNDGAVDFSPEFTVAESMLYRGAKDETEQPWDGFCFTADVDGEMFREIPEEQRPRCGDITFSRGRHEYAFLVVEYSSDAEKDKVRAELKPFQSAAPSPETSDI